MEGSASSDIIVQLMNGIAIRRFRRSDIKDLSRHADNRNVTRYLRNRMPQPYTEADAESWIERNFDTANHVKSGPWSVETGSQGPAIPAAYAITSNDELIGTVGLEFGDPKDVYARTAELGYWLSEDFWGKGVMGKVVPAFVDWTWTTFEVLVRLNADVFAENAGSKRCLEMAGFKEEGRRKFNVIKHGVLGDDIMMGCLRPGLEDAK